MLLMPAIRAIKPAEKEDRRNQAEDDYFERAHPTKATRSIPPTMAIKPPRIARYLPIDGLP